MTGKTDWEEQKARRVILEPRNARPIHEYDGVIFYPGGQMIITNANLKHFIAVVQKDTPVFGDQITLDYRC